MPSGFWTGILQVLALFVGLRPSGWTCPPPNSVAVPLVASCSFSCVLGSRNYVALQKCLLGLTGCYGIKLEDSIDVIWFGILIALQLISFHFLTDFLTLFVICLDLQ